MEGYTQIVDLAEGWAEFVRAFPALVRPDGYPISWRVYRVAMRQLGVEYSRDSLKLYRAMLMAGNVKEEPRKEWVDRHERGAHAGLWAWAKPVEETPRGNRPGYPAGT